MEILWLWLEIMINLICLKRSMRTDNWTTHQINAKQLLRHDYVLLFIWLLKYIKVISSLTFINIGAPPKNKRNSHLKVVLAHHSVNIQKTLVLLYHCINNQHSRTQITSHILLLCTFCFPVFAFLKFSYFFSIVIIINTIVRSKVFNFIITYLTQAFPFFFRLF